MHIRKVLDQLDEINRRGILKSISGGLASSMIPKISNANQILLDPFYIGMNIEAVKSELKQFLDLEQTGARPSSAKILGMIGISNVDQIKLEKPSNVLGISSYLYFQFDKNNNLLAIHLYAKLPRSGFFDNGARGFVKDRAVFNESCMRLFEKIQSIGIVGSASSNKPSVESYENMGGGGVELIGSTLQFSKGSVIAIGIRSYMGHVLSEMVITIDK